MSIDRAIEEVVDGGEPSQVLERELAMNVIQDVAQELGVRHTKFQLQSLDENDFLLFPPKSVELGRLTDALQDHWEVLDAHMDRDEHSVAVTLT